MNKNISNIKSIIILGFIFLYIISRGCNRDTHIKGNKEVQIITISDTTHEYVQHIDTIPFIDTIKRYVSVSITQPKIVPETGLNEYSGVFSDSLIEGKIISVVDGNIIKQTFNYTPKFPKYIIKTDSIFTTIENTVTKIINKREVYIGFELGGSLSKFNISPMISLKDKKHNLYSFRYGVLDKTFNIGIQRKIKFN